MNTENFISLESIQIATPCHAEWGKMAGDDKSRFCASCSKNVYNLSAMSRADAEWLMAEKEGHLCLRLYRRSDGTVITNDCPVGISPAQRSAGLVRNLLAASIAAILGLFGGKLAHAGIANLVGAPVELPSAGTVTMGSPAP